jgi:hypothetical protein
MLMLMKCNALKEAKHLGCYMAHPRANGQVERANGMILDALKKRLYRKNDKAPRKWLKELSVVV